MIEIISNNTVLEVVTDGSTNTINIDDNSVDVITAAIQGPPGTFETHNHNDVGRIQFTLPTGKNETYTILQNSPSITITDAVCQTNSGTIVADILNDGVNITGLSTININSTESITSATANNMVTDGGKIEITLTGNDTAQMVSVCLSVTKII